MKQAREGGEEMVFRECSMKEMRAEGETDGSPRRRF